jgi:hypothetical protein
MDEDDGTLTDDDGSTTPAPKLRLDQVSKLALYTQIKWRSFKSDTVPGKDLHIQGFDPDSNHGAYTIPAQLSSAQTD